MRIGVCPGSFDPVTNGHIDIIERSAKLVDKLIVAVSVNQGKSGGTFTKEERIDMLEHALAHLDNVEVKFCPGLLNTFVKEEKGQIVFRGLRAVGDFEYEFQRAAYAKYLDPDIETVFIMTSHEYMFVSSTGIRELARFGGKMDGLVPDYVKDKVISKFGSQANVKLGDLTMNTELLLEDLETLVETSNRIPMTTKRMVEEDEMMRIIDSIQESLPLELEESRRIVAEKDAVLADAKKQAEELIAQAKEYISKLTAESEIVKAAQEQANEIIANANKSSEELRNSSVQYGADVLKYVESNLEKTLESIRQNRESLRQSAHKEDTHK